MILGKYHSATGIYTFPDPNGVEHSYTAKWFANPFRMRIDECKPILEAGYDAGSNKWPKAILVLNDAKWNAIKDAGYGSWVGLTKIHCFDTTVNAGTCPAWARDFQAYDGFTIHEYASGKVAFMRKFEDIYIFFKDSAPPPADPVTPPVTPPVEQPDDDVIIVPSIAKKWRVTGKLWFLPIDMTIEAVDE